MPENQRGGLHELLDRLELAASALGLVLLAAGVAALLGGVYYIVSHWPEGYGWGPQGETFYLGIALLLVFSWLVGQISWFVRRRRRSSMTFTDGSEIPLPKVDIGESGVSIRWGQRPRTDDSADSPRTWSWNMPLPGGPTRTFSLSHTAISVAREARAAGASWDDVCELVNPEWTGLNVIDRQLYQHALRDALGRHGEMGETR